MTRDTFKAKGTPPAEAQAQYSDAISDGGMDPRNLAEKFHDDYKRWLFLPWWQRWFGPNPMNPYRERLPPCKPPSAPVGVVEALSELVDLMQGVIDGEYKPDSFTLQPARAALAQQPATEFRNDGNSESDFIAHHANACTACGGSGHKADQQPEARAERLAEALRDLLDQLESVGIYIPGEDSGQWAGTEGLSFTQAEAALHSHQPNNNNMERT